MVLISSPMSRRRYLHYLAGGIVLGGALGYASGYLTAPQVFREVTKTITETSTQPAVTLTTTATATTTVTETPTKTVLPRVGKSPVSIVKGSNVNEMVREALDLIGGIGKVADKGSLVLIKPNFTWVGDARIPSYDGKSFRGRQPSQTKEQVAANTTDPSVIEALVQVAQSAGCKVVIGEGSGGCETMDAFEITGVDQIAKDYKVPLVDLNRDEAVKVAVPEPLILHELWVPKTVIEADVLISVPALKAWPLSGITVSLKNLIGTAPGNYYGWSKNALPHGSLPTPTIDRTIVDLAQVNRISLSIVDGIWGNQGTWTKGLKPVRMDLIIAGFDPVAVDSVSASVMGFDPLKVRHLNIAAAKGLGTNLMDNIDVRGEMVYGVMKPFEPPEGLEYIAAP